MARTVLRALPTVAIAFWMTTKDSVAAEIRRLRQLGLPTVSSGATPLAYAKLRWSG